MVNSAHRSPVLVPIPFSLPTSVAQPHPDFSFQKTELPRVTELRTSPVPYWPPCGSLCYEGKGDSLSAVPPGSSALCLLQVQKAEDTQGNGEGEVLHTWC